MTPRRALRSTSPCLGRVNMSCGRTTGVGETLDPVRTCTDGSRLCNGGLSTGGRTVSTMGRDGTRVRGRRGRLTTRACGASVVGGLGFGGRCCSRLSAARRGGRECGSFCGGRFVAGTGRVVTRGRTFGGVLNDRGACSNGPLCAPIDGKFNCDVRLAPKLGPSVLFSRRFKDRTRDQSFCGGLVRDLRDSAPKAGRCGSTVGGVLCCEGVVEPGNGGNNFVPGFGLWGLLIVGWGGAWFCVGCTCGDVLPGSRRLSKVKFWAFHS